MDAAGHALYRAVNVYARATSTADETATSTTTSTSTASSTSSADSKNGRPPIYKIVGIILAVCSGLFIGVSFVIKKVGLLKANVKYNEEAGEGYGYLKNAWWWLGMTLMIVGEICNFVAYAFTDAILVTPLGALAVVVTAILSAIFLKERLSFVGWVACFMCIVGSVIITLNAPEQSAVSDIQEMQHYVIAPGFLSYAGVIIVGCGIVAWYVGPRYGKKSMMVYLTICSLIGGLSVVATQGLGAAILAQINGEAQFNKWFMYVLLVFVISTLLTEIVYLNVSKTDFSGRAYTDICVESTQHLQRSSGHADVLRIFHSIYNCGICCPVPRFPWISNRHNRCHNGVPCHLLRSCPATIGQIIEGRTRHKGSERRARSNQDCG